MTARTAHSSLPKPFVVAMLVAMGLAIVAAAAGRITGPVDAGIGAHAKPVAARDLRFVDRADGGVEVFDVATGASVSVLPAGSNNFLRAMMRVLAHRRMTYEGTPDTPFRLTAWDDGRLTLADPATGGSVGLEAFGADNEIVFARLLAPEKAP